MKLNFGTNLFNMNVFHISLLLLSKFFTFTVNIVSYTNLAISDTFLNLLKEKIIWILYII